MRRVWRARLCWTIGVYSTFLMWAGDLLGVAQFGWVSAMNGVSIKANYMTVIKDRCRRDGRVYSRAGLQDDTAAPLKAVRAATDNISRLNMDHQARRQLIADPV